MSLIEKGVTLAQKVHDCMLARAFLWEHSYKWLKLAQLLGQLIHGVFLTLTAAIASAGVAGLVAREPVIRM
jgi:hypothetical protein